MGSDGNTTWVHVLNSGYAMSFFITMALHLDMSLNWVDLTFKATACLFASMTSAAPSSSRQASITTDCYVNNPIYFETSQSRYLNQCEQLIVKTTVKFQFRKYDYIHGQECIIYLMRITHSVYYYHQFPIAFRL